MKSAPLPPDRRRQYFARNGGPRLNEQTRRTGLAGLAEARKVLRQHADVERLIADCATRSQRTRRTRKRTPR